MKNKLYLCYLVVVSIFFPICNSFAEEVKAIPAFVGDDRVLILAPHPDDETIGSGGVIQRALKAGSKVKVVCYTNGDNNEFAFIVYEKRITFRKGEFIYMGEVRRKETVKAMDFLGIGQDDIIFLGYPDFGTMEILTKYWGTTMAFKSMLTRVSKVVYPESMSVNAPYVGESILKDLKSIILNFKPTKIFVSHPVDTNVDHRSLYLFLEIALWDLEGQISRPQVFPYLIHVVGWPKPRGYHQDLELEPPPKIANGNIFWQALELNDKEIDAKYKAIYLYKSEIESAFSYLMTFARKNELFSDVPVIKLKNGSNDIEWHDIGISKERETSRRTDIASLAYAKDNKDLFIKLDLKKKINKDFGISIFLLGYSRSKDFAEMPKIRLYIGHNGIHIRDKKRKLFVKDADLRYEGKSLIVNFPLDGLGNPDYLLASAKTSSHTLPFDDTVWRIIELLIPLAR